MLSYFFYTVAFFCYFCFVSNNVNSYETGVHAPKDNRHITNSEVAGWIPSHKDSSFNSSAAYKGHYLPRLRGAMVSPNVSGPDLLDLGLKWNANLVRWQLNWVDRSVDKTDMQAYDRWLEKALTRLDYLLPVCKKAGLMVLIDLHTPPGGMNKDKEQMIFKEKKYQSKLLEVWERIALRYKGHDVIWGYDIVNEPVWKKQVEGLLSWQSLADLTVKSIRAIDPDHAIIVEPGDWGNPKGLNDFRPVSASDVVYSVHMYEPHAFTHQGVEASNPTGLTYPGVINGKLWNKDQLRKELKPAIDFQKKYGVHIYIGEFSAIAWAPGNSSYNYLKDVIEIFEENGWDWSYHAFREWTGWSVEHKQDRKEDNPVKMETDRQHLLKTWFSKNLKPALNPPEALQ